MGFNFRSGHPDAIFRPDRAISIERMLRDALGPSVPLGTPGVANHLPSELGWSWWAELQQFVMQKLGADSAPQVCGIDASCGVYVDANIDRLLLWEEGEAPATPPQIRLPSLEDLGLPEGEAPEAVLEEIHQMLAVCGPREGEAGALQVGNLRALKQELERVYVAVGDIAPTRESVMASIQHLEDIDDYEDEYGGLVCLHHCWYTAEITLEQQAPLWLVK